jgi:hypothetical protein
MHHYSMSFALLIAMLANTPSMAKESPQHCTNTYRPAGVASVFPVEKSVHKFVSSVGATFRFRQELKADPESFKLFLNGVDVTSKSRFSSTRDQPPSRVHIAYSPRISETGTHQAKVVFRTTDGINNCYQWNFQIRKN